MNIDWEAIARKLANALITVESEPYRLKTWNSAYDALQEYNEACRQRSEQPN